MPNGVQPEMDLGPANQKVLRGSDLSAFCFHQARVRFSLWVRGDGENSAAPIPHVSLSAMLCTD